MNIPLRPPTVNNETNPMAHNIGVWKRMFPRHIVPNQLNTLIADGTAIAIVEIMNDVPNSGFIPLWNIWWPQVIQPRKAIAMIASTIE